jgi:succinoglycan biosynthesis transport protein ExoP
LHWQPSPPSASRALVPRQTPLLTAPAPPPVLSLKPTPMALLAALKRRWLLALTLGIVAAAIGVTVVYTLPISWRARTLVHVAAIRPFILYPQESRIDFATYQRSQLTLVKSRLVIRGALEKPEIAELPVVKKLANPVEWLENQLQVDFAQGPEIMSIALIGNIDESPEPLIKLVSAVRDTYITEILDKEQTLQLKRLDQIQKLYDRYDELLKEKRARLKEMAESLGSRKSQSLQLKQQFLYSHLEGLQKELVQLQSQARKLRIELQVLESRHRNLHNAAISEAMVDARLRTHPEIAKLQSAVDEREAQLVLLRQRFKNPEDPTILQERASLAAAAKALEERRAELRDKLTQQLREERLTEADAAISAHRDQLEQVQELEKTLEEHINKQAKDIDAVGRGTINLEWLDEEIALLTDVFKRIGAQKEALQVETAAPSRMSILEDAYAQPTRAPKDIQKMAGMAGAGLFILAVLGVALLEFQTRRVNAVGEVTHGLGLRLLGVLPNVPGHAWNKQLQKATDARWRRVLDECVDIARTMLVHAVQHEGMQIVMVTSANKGEGKTLLSSHLAVSLARSGFKTLFIDADFRQPTAHRLFDLPGAPGMSEVLRGQLSPVTGYYSEVLPGLAVMTAGQWDDSLIEVLAQQHRLANILNRLKRQHDFLVIDTAPVLATPDTMLIAQHVDGVLFSVLRGISRLPAVYAARERMEMLGVPVVGAVVGKADMNGLGGYYYYGRGVGEG